MANTSVEQLIKEIKVSKLNEKFSKYIKSITLPHYKNFEPLTKITFDFPLSVFVGKNGSGKSSILHALYGCPLGLSPRPFWFSTDVDPIKDNATEDNENLAQSYVYEYFDSNLKEKNGTVFKKRSIRPGTKTKKRDPEYWETSKPALKYGLKTTMKRSAPLDEKVIYMDFRSELSAYDKFFYFGNMENLSSSTKQVYVRKYPSKSLKKVFTEKKQENQIIYRKGKKQNDLPIWLSPKEVQCISEILGNNYKGIRMIHNRFFNRTWGYTVLLIRDNLSYTEAQAGSGEYAVVMLVHKLLELDKNDHRLVLLDEPETSLFPGAQRRLLKFILKFIYETNNQVIISSHSTYLIDGLPDTAIKKVAYDPISFKTKVQDKCSPSVAFQELESPTQKTKIFVEDEAAKIILEKCLTVDQRQIFYLQPCSGAESMNKYFIYTNAMENNHKSFYFFDGDQLSDSLTDFFNLSENQVDNYISDLDNRIKILNEICPNIEFGNNRPRKKEKRDHHYDIKKDGKLENEQIKYLKYYHSHVFYLPKEKITNYPNYGTPETIILSSYIDGLLNLLKMDKVNWNSISSTNKIKVIFRKIIEQRSGSECDTLKYNAFISELCEQWKQIPNNFNYKNIRAIMKKIEDKP